MQVQYTLDAATGNDKHVEISENVNSHTGKSSFFGEVQYDFDPELNFGERFRCLRDAKRWFATWSKLTHEEERDDGTR